MKDYKQMIATVEEAHIRARLQKVGHKERSRNKRW
jgi:hypothetical protein